MNYQHLLQLDQQDPLQKLRDEFSLPDDTIYLDGNSLGPMPRRCAERAQQVIEKQWSQDLIKSWNLHGWIDLPAQVGEKIAALIGAAPEQVICCDSTSINLFKVLSSALLLQPGRQRILSVQGNFPTDLYMVQGLANLVGEQRCQLQVVAEADLEPAITEDVAVLLLSHVDFKTGRLLDMPRLTQLAHEKGILVIWDLAHSAGALPVALDDCQVDFAVGCGYKYLNGGPGAPAFLYVAKRHIAKVSQPLSGWMGHKQPFSFTLNYEKPESVAHFLTGTPPILSMSVLDAALTVFEGVDLTELRRKSLALADTFHQLLSSHTELNDLTLITPLAAEVRGSQLAYRHADAYALCQALIKRGVIADFRSPDILRLGFTPLYLRYIDIWIAVEILSDVVKTAEYRKPEYAVKQKVT